MRLKPSMMLQANAVLKKKKCYMHECIRVYDPMLLIQERTPGEYGDTLGFLFLTAEVKPYKQ
jgi:hypothetical protein